VPAYNRCSREVAGGREAVGGGRSSADGRDNITRPERRAPASSMHPCGEGVWPVPESGLDQPVEPVGAPAASAGLSARAIGRADGLNPLQALQRVLYRCAKQDPARRFHALYDKLTRSDVMWRAWCEVAANRGAPGVDGVTIDAVAADGVPGVQAFLGELAQRLRDGSYWPARCDGSTYPSPASPVSKGRCRSRRWPIGW
jgi:hypothetical protein